MDNEMKLAICKELAGFKAEIMNKQVLSDYEVDKFGEYLRPFCIEDNEHYVLCKGLNGERKLIVLPDTHFRVINEIVTRN